MRSYLCDRSTIIERENTEFQMALETSDAREAEIANLRSRLAEFEK